MSSILKYIFVISCFLLCLIRNFAFLYDTQVRLLLFALFFTVCADYFLIFTDKILTGILLFLVKCPLPSSNLLLQRTPQPGGGLLSWALLLYSGYNFLSAMIVLPEIGREYTKKQKVLGCGLGIAGVFLCIFLIHNAFLECYSIAETADMPLIQLIFTLGSKKASGISLSLLTLTLLLSVCGSAVGFARMAAPGNGERKIGIFMTAAGTPLAFLGFGNLMDYVYPAFGAAGGIMLLIYLTGYFKKIILYRKNKMRSGHGTVEFQE